MLAKLEDLETPGFVGDFDPDEAELAGASRVAVVPVVSSGAGN